MAKRCTFKNPPIVEALIDIRVSKPHVVKMSALESFQESVKDRFPLKEARQSWRGGFRITKDAGPELDTPVGGVDGFFFKSGDKSKVVQARKDGFTFSKLKPYESWDVFRAEAEDLWMRYVDVTKPQSIDRLAVRYINSIDIPVPFADFKEYVLTMPDLPEGIPQGIANFFMRMTLPKHDIGSVAVVTQTFKDLKHTDEFLSFIFDIDAIKQIQLEPTDQQVWGVLEELRHFKNDVFFESLTSKTKELFQ